VKFIQLQLDKHAVEAGETPPNISTPK